jgi:hypothetical protein
MQGGYILGLSTFFLNMLLVTLVTLLKGKCALGNFYKCFGD